VHFGFTENRVAEALRGSTECDVRIGRFRRVYFPSPGCELDDVAFERGARVMMGKAKRILIQSTWAAVLSLRKEVKLLKSDGLVARIPKDVPEPAPTTSKQAPIAIEELIADGAVLEMGHLPVGFEIKKLKIRMPAKIDG